MKIVRSATSATLALTAALALAACTPPHQNDSDQPFKDNQTGVASHSAENSSSTATSSEEAHASNGNTKTNTEETSHLVEPLAPTVGTPSVVTEAPVR
ncbi:hypothetical protein [Corynebacterium anserum]|uniref:Uncharacterized protein n=1 Tax=Corynebacterium anserum TaxID=2684406 RepID=A0A7G7YNL4_9CORY|nr:hypothetical protein [Corynebacterium anserum]MBC2681664.1 hypothetical protein [Corynebacterium anserum]QNH96084.1 hypothetical protein GP473_04880 [Corynebacterium anserum]